jgi:hypothetical protein
MNAFLSASSLIRSSGILEIVCCLFVDMETFVYMETYFVMSWFLLIYLHGNVC